MNRKGPLPQPDAGDETPIQEAVRRAVASLGWTLPQDEQTVAEAERALDAQPVELPAELADPTQAMARSEAAQNAQDVVLRLPLPQTPDIDATLARAAREAGRISPRVEEAMRRDRAAAEAQQQAQQARKDSSHGEDVR